MIVSRTKLHTLAQDPDNRAHHREYSLLVRKFRDAAYIDLLTREYGMHTISHSLFIHVVVGEHQPSAIRWLLNVLTEN